MLWRRLAIVLLPLILILNVYQNKKYLNYQRQINVVNRHRRQLIEDNKRLIAEIAILGSPRRIDYLSSQINELKPISPDRVLRIILPEEQENP